MKTTGETDFTKECLGVSRQYAAHASGFAWWFRFGRSRPDADLLHRGRFWYPILHANKTIYLPEFEQTYEEHYARRCGDLHFGFARVRCPG